MSQGRHGSGDRGPRESRQRFSGWAGGVSAEPARTGRPGGRTGVRARRLQVILTAVLLVAGLLVGWQLRAERRIRASLQIPSQRLDELTFLLQEQGRRRDALEAEIARLREQLARTEERATERRGAQQALRRQLQTLRLAAGVEAVRGPGVVVELRDSPRPLRPGDDPNLVLVHYTDVQAVVAALWAAGAEAVAVNGERVVSTTGLSCVGTTILCNARRLAPPYVVVAMGDPDALEAAMDAPSSPLAALRAFQFPVRVTKAQDLRVPAYRGGFEFRFARADR